MTDPNTAPAGRDGIIEGNLPDLTEMPMAELATTQDPAVLGAARILTAKTLNRQEPEVTVRPPYTNDLI